jgi:hypothetical protein
MKSWRNPAGVPFLLVLVIALCGTGMSQEPAQQTQEQTQEPAQQAADEPVLVVPEGTNLPIILSTFLNSGDFIALRASAFSLSMSRWEATAPSHWRRRRPAEQFALRLEGPVRFGAEAT